ncbi:MAG TPA: thiamine pyrophosphate-dependent enzyme [Anaerolineaceae bacterium]|jgi:pyruvate ferredoxin oxidoreductase beta subunit/phenylglyoxylate dehydrogenase beta subunit|nr:thiamine pyrophosphate-dependent enzyme [Anaerolineaceae bacterium]HOH20722.1 thiamine pyrophosphate-dependent enzyme [Anaerolineaceae bacterium]HOU44685.1 thiamine pyrophosphate-dependent enzyme [Anaerolineaceae bacterium]HQF46264.1 thiamine pyrophosphate-dependent enzyme [Anaerolineaceae bacterium]HQH36204.1 thiamine pyrophosphate-dependent enzyme [Anaerolineaceae bacterium]
MNLIDKLATWEDQISPGISACVGCNVELTLRTCMKVMGPNTIFAIPPGCMGGVGVVGWDKKSGAKTPVFFPLLDNVASMLAGIKLHYEHIGRDVNVVAFAGDGATVDAGMQCLSGAAERGDKIIYICYDNEGYMNTGYQRSGSTTKGAWTSTTPVNHSGQGGKRQNKKDFPLIMAMHDIPYMATMNPAYIPDMVRKLEKAKEIKTGLVYLHVYNPCVTGWGFQSDFSIEVSRLAVESNFAPLYEVENGKFKMSVEIRNPKPVKEFLSRFKKFSHLTDEDIQELQEWTDFKINRLKHLCTL